MTEKTWNELWAEKPTKRGGAFHGDALEWRDPHYDDDEIDAFHEKLKAKGGKLEENLHGIRSLYWIYNTLPLFRLDLVTFKEFLEKLDAFFQSSPPMKREL